MRLKWSNVPIPEAHLAGIIAGIILQLIFPLSINWQQWIGYLLGGLVIGSGALLAGWAVITAADLDIEAPAGILTSGPYAFSRNPMYVAWTLVNLGIALVANNLWILLSLPIVILYTHKFVILNEEQILEGQFGEQYQEYKNEVRRYL
jgi:protein-S-isoprenylcysteine O-methyltransferase Ste14